MGATPELNGTAHGMPGDHLPGTTVPEHSSAASLPKTLEMHGTEPAANGSPQTFPGPTIQGRKTITTLYEPAQFAVSPVIPPLRRLINVAFDQSHRRIGVPINHDRLPTQEDYIRQVGSDPGTFVYTVTWSDTGEPVATAGAHRYDSTVLMVDGGDASEGDARRTFTRVQLPAIAEGKEVWELKLMAVDVAFRGHGLASYLMKLVDDEVLRRRSGGARGLCMVLTTVTEANGLFYRKKGYVEDYETSHGPGFMGTPDGFHVVHMSRVLEG